MRKEPARAVTAIQGLLDGSVASCALLADLSKAFERVNSHWIGALLRSKEAPEWVIRYSRFVLFERQVTHKVRSLWPKRNTLAQTLTSEFCPVDWALLPLSTRW